MASTPTTIPITQTRTSSILSLRSILVRFLAVLFFASLFIPLIGAWLHWDFSTAANENRRLAEMPSIPKSFKDAQKYSDRWLNFFRDHFGLRNTLIHSVAVTRFQGLGSDTDGNVIIGKDGWLFYRPDGDQNLIAYRGLNPFSDDELNVWQELLEKRNAFLASRGIPLLVVVPPDKQTIYPEYLPPEFHRLRPQSRLDQLIDRLRQTHSPVRLIDLRPALLAAKPTALLYYRTDTHWNDSGSYVGYRAIIPFVQQLLPRWHIVPQTYADFYRTPPHLEIGDLAKMIDMPDQYPDPEFSLIRKIPFTMPPTLADRNESTTTDSHDPAKPRLVFYHDSFALGLAQMLGPHFGRVVYACYYGMDSSQILPEKPDLVIDEFLERNLYLPPPTDSADIRHFNLR
jgi:alginate O-acetyltransferase complex protein AlgJ